MDADPELVMEFVAGYHLDPAFDTALEGIREKKYEWHLSQRYPSEEDGLQYPRDADFVLRLCILHNLKAHVLRETDLRSSLLVHMSEPTSCVYRWHPDFTSLARNGGAVQYAAPL